VTFMNRIAAELTGRGTTATRERPLAEVLRTSNQRIGEPLQDPFTRIVANKAELELASQRILLRADGTSITIDENATPMRRADGTLAGVVVSFRESNARQAANAELHADQRKDDFFAILAHELRNPLGCAGRRCNDVRRTRDHRAAIKAPHASDR
jgi:nitrogen-specific signal transduction histidine kinase